LVSASERLAFVLENFLLVFQNQSSQPFVINYATQFESGLFVPNLSENYFEAEIPFNHIKLQWIKYNEEQIPLLFANAEIDKPFLVIDNSIIFQFDIISAIFFFLSGWQETVIKSVDNLGRFTYKKSIQKQLNISSLPVVNYYILMLKEALNLAYKTKFFNKINPQNKYNTIVSHDVDYWASLWRKEAKYAVKKLKFFKVMQLAFKCFEIDYYQNSFKIIKALQIKYGFTSTFFFLPDTKKYKGHESADYEISNPIFRKFIKMLAIKNQIGLHGSFTSHISEENLKRDLARFNAVLPININRFHFLMFSQKTTSNLLQNNGIQIDSTLGFNDMPGFRFGTSYPFYLFDYQHNKAGKVVEIPLLIMDATLFYPHYLGCKSKNEAWEFIDPIVSQVYKTGGNLVLNWHNDAFADLGREIWVETFDQILKYGNERGSEFTNFNF